jgi:predicted RNA-binding protein with PIN domain
MRADAEVFIDGYNIAKLVWPALALSQQRDRCIEHAEEVARRFGAAITVVFDGASVSGASSPRRLVRVIYSPEGTSADDLIRDRVAAVPVSTAVVVVTNDRAIQLDVRKHGANVLSSDALAALAR